MKSWANLKGSMDKIGDQVRQILFVRNDLSMMQDDLKTQERLWADAETKLVQENAVLDTKLQALRVEIKKDATLEYQVRQLLNSLQEARAEEAAAKIRMAQDAARAANETAHYRNHERALFQQLVDLNATFNKEEQDALERQAQVEADGGILERKADELRTKLKRIKAEALLKEQEDAAKTLDLNNQILQMQQGLVRLKGQELPRWQLDQETAKLRRQLQQETLTILKVQQDGAQVAADCDAERTRRKEVLQKEKAKAEARVEQKSQFCNTVRGQNQVLSQMLQACQYPAAVRKL